MQSFSVDDLIDQLRTPADSGARGALKRAWSDGSLVAWLETRNWHFGQPDDALLARIQDLGSRVGDDAELGLFALLQTLEPGRPLALLPDVELDVPGQIEALFAAHPKRRRELLAALSQCASNGRLAEWLRACDFPGWEPLVRRLERLPNTFIRGIEHLPAYVVRWHFDARAPFPVENDEVSSPKALAAWMEASAGHRALGETLLETGWIDLWLESTGRRAGPGLLESLRELDCSDQARRELLLRSLDPDRPAPKLRLDPDRLDLGKLAPGASVQRSLTLKSRGGGHIWGSASLDGETVGMRLEPLAFDGAPARFTLNVDTSGIPPFTNRAAEVVVHCNDGREERVLRVPIRYRVRVPVAGTIGRSLLVGAVAGGVMGLLRLWAGSTINGPGAADQTLDWVSMDWVAGVFDRSFGEFLLLVAMAVALLGAVIGGIVYLSAVCRR